MANSYRWYTKASGMAPITESEAEIVQNDSDMSVSQYSNKMAIFEKIDWDTFSLRTSHIVVDVLCAYCMDDVYVRITTTPSCTHMHTHTHTHTHTHRWRRRGYECWSFSGTTTSSAPTACRAPPSGEPWTSVASTWLSQRQQPSRRGTYVHTYMCTYSIDTVYCSGKFLRDKIFADGSKNENYKMFADVGLP